MYFCLTVACSYYPGLGIVWGVFLALSKNASRRIWPCSACRECPGWINTLWMPVMSCDVNGELQIKFKIRQPGDDTIC